MKLQLRYIAMGLLVVAFGWRLAAAQETDADEAAAEIARAAVAEPADAAEEEGPYVPDASAMASPYADLEPSVYAEAAQAAEALLPAAPDDWESDVAVELTTANEPAAPNPPAPAQEQVEANEPAESNYPPAANDSDAAHEPPVVDSPGSNETLDFPFGLGGPDEWTSPEGLSSTLKMLLLLTVVSLAPAVLLMTTCFVRIVVVLGLLRQALGTAQLPSNQVVTSIALFMTLLVMWPVWNDVYTDAIEPYTAHEITLQEAWDHGVKPVRGFMSAQIERTGNSDDVWLFYKYLPEATPSPSSYDDVPLVALLPAYMLSELKTAFLIGFQIYLPFLVVDLVVASVTISMGMVMLPPVLVSLPLKLLLFVLVDGWHLVVGMLLESFQAFS